MYHAATIEDVRQKIADESIAIVYISMPNCSVCVSVKPQLVQRFDTKVPIIHADAADIPEVAGEFQVLTAPAVLLYVDQKEVHREARFIDFHKLEELVENYSNISGTVDYDELFK